MELYRLRSGSTPLLISMPHAGTWLPPAIAATLTEAGRAVADTDWHVDRLYAFAAELGAGLLAATHSRYEIDLNRAPDGADLYPGANNTELCPTTTFDEQPIYQADGAPDEAEIGRRRRLYWQPYHDRLKAELDRILERHGRALLWEGHSIRSLLPRFFAGRLPDLNIGTAGGASAGPEIERAVAHVAEAANGYTSALNGRFTGGYTTRAYGDPARGVHAVQLELAQVAYMTETPPFAYLPDRAEALQKVLKRMLEAALGAL